MGYNNNSDDAAPRETRLERERRQLRMIFKMVAIGASALFVIITALSSFYTVSPTEMAGVRRLQTVITEHPVGPGFHFKIPYVDTVDKLQISQDSLLLDKLRIYTSDNQEVSISIGVTYRIPETSVLRLLYKLGKTGDVDISRNFHQIIGDRAKRVFAPRNTLKISDEREAIAIELQRVLTDTIRDLLGIEVIDVQIPSINYSETFSDSVNKAVQAKNDAVAAENTVRRMRFEGEQRIVTAKADAEAEIARATAARQASILKAEGEAMAIKLAGDAEAQRIAARSAALKGAVDVIELTRAERWNGQLPSTMFGGNSGAIPMFTLDTAKK